MRRAWITSIIGLVLTTLSIYGILNGDNSLFSKSEINIDIEKIGEQIFSIPKKDIDLQVFLPSPLVFERDSSMSVDDTQTDSSTSQINQANIIYYTNLSRQAEGESVLSQNIKLTSSAQKKAQDILDRQYFEHDSPEGIGVSDLVDQAGYEYIVVGENLARGDFKNASEVVDAWMNSPAHRENILNNKFKEIGIGIVYGKYEGLDSWILVQHFGASIDTCPEIDSSLKIKIEKDEITIDSLEEDIYLKLDEINSTNKWSSEYNDLVEEYNALISEYNSKVVTIKEDISTYNTQVEVFNACVSS